MNSNIGPSNLADRLDALGRRLIDQGIDDLRPAAGVASLGLLSQASILKWLENVGSQSTSIYDRAMDARYLADHIGGGQHRLFDGGHDPVGAWQRVAAATESDSVAAEIDGYVTAMLNDASTPAGLPLATWDPESYQVVSGWFADVVPGATRSWFADLVSYDVGEVLACGVGVVCTLLGMQRKDEEAVSEIIGSSMAVGIVSANPLVLIGLIVTGAMAHRRKMRLHPKAMLQGAGLGAIGMLIFELLSLPILIELVAVVVVLVLARRGIDWVRKWMDVTSADVYRELKLPVLVTRSSSSVEREGGLAELERRAKLRWQRHT